MGSGGSVSSPSGSGRSPAAERYLVDLGLQKSFSVRAIYCIYSREKQTQIWLKYRVIDMEEGWLESYEQ